MSAPLRKLHGARRSYGVPEDIFRAILLGQIGKYSAKDITMGSVDACIEQFKKHNPAAIPKKPEKKKDWREPAKSPHARKIYVLWGILKRNGVFEARYPDGFVKRMTGMQRAEWLTPVKANVVIESLIDIIKREGLASELR